MKSILIIVISIYFVSCKEQSLDFDTSGLLLPVSQNIVASGGIEDSEYLIELPYKTESKESADSCSVQVQSQLQVTTPCSCSSGICTVGITGQSQFNGQASFDFSVSVGSKKSNTSTVDVAIAGSDDPPTTTNKTETNGTEDFEKIITLSYDDPEYDNASACSVSNLSNITQTTACSCSNGLCTVGVTGTSQYNGAAGFDFDVTVAGVTSNTSSISYTIDNFDDAPIGDDLNPTFAYKNTEKTISLTYTDEESDLATSCSVSNFVGAFESTACSCDGSGVCSVGLTGTLNFVGQASFDFSVSNAKTSDVKTVNYTVRPDPVVVDDYYVSQDPGSIKNFTISVGSAPFTYDIFEKDTYLKVSTTTSSNATTAITLPTKAGDYKLRIKDSLGGMTWVDIVANKGASSFTTKGVTVAGTRRGISSVGDYNNDGNLDFITIGLSGSVYKVYGYHGNGDSTFTYDQEFGVGNHPQLVDLQADGDLDLIYLDPWNKEFCYRLQKADQTFEAENCTALTDPSEGTAIYHMARAIMLNDDEYPDIIFGGSNGGGVVYYAVAKADGSFEPIKQYAAMTGDISGTYISISVGDMNNDGYEDAITVSPPTSGKRDFSTFLNGGESNIMGYSVANLNAGGVAWGLNSPVCIADMNGDGYKDFVNRALDSHLYVYHNNASMNYTLFESKTRTYFTGNPSSTYDHACTDFNGDGNMDIMAPMSNRYYVNGGNEHGFFFATGDGAGGMNAISLFESSYQRAWWQNGSGRFGDMNNDGVLDFIAGSLDNGAMYVEEGVE
ncbi:MAG: VCBS repeat-containing protein [Bacteriovoracaceae bacterium]|jgi:hypothetical protein|nr:VCBS repeat-containing protein [Bacteriovoracaceae bacterium]